MYKELEAYYLIKNLNTSNSISVRLKSINSLTNLVLNRKCDENLFNEFWPKICDLLDYSQPQDVREFVINLIYAFVIGQYDSLGIYKTKILELMNSRLSSKEDVFYKLHLFKLLTKNGHDLTFIENLLGDVIKEFANLLFDFSMTTRLNDTSHYEAIISFLQIFSNLIKYNSITMPEVLIGWIFKKACFFTNLHYSISINPMQKMSVKQNFPIMTSSLIYESLFQAIFNASSYDYLPQDALSQIVTFLCLLRPTYDSDYNSQNRWNIIEEILLSTSGFDIFEDLCGRLIYIKPLDNAETLYYKDICFSKVCSESFKHRPFCQMDYELAPIIVASSIDYISRFFWNDWPIKHIISLPSHSVLPLFYQVLSWNSVAINLEIAKALIKLLDYSSDQIALPITAWELLIQIFNIVSDQMAEIYDRQPFLDFLIKKPTNNNKHHILYSLQQSMCRLAFKLKSRLDDEDMLEKFLMVLEPMWMYFVSPICEDNQLIESIIQNKVESLLDMILWQDYDKCFTVLPHFVDQFFYQSTIKLIICEKMSHMSDAFLPSLNKAKFEAIKGISNILDIIVCSKQISELLSKIILPLMRHYFGDATIRCTHETMDNPGEISIIGVLMEILIIIFKKRYPKHLGCAKTREVWVQGLLECLRLVIKFQTTVLQFLSDSDYHRTISDVQTILDKWQLKTMPIITMTFKHLLDITFFSYPARFALKIASHLITCLRLQYSTSIKCRSSENFVFDQTSNQAALFYSSNLGCETRYIILDCLTSIYVMHNTSGLNLLGLRRQCHSNFLNFDVAPSLYLDLILKQTLGADSNIKCNSNNENFMTYEEKFSYNYLLSPSLSLMPEVYNQNCKHNFDMTLLEASYLYSMHNEEIFTESPCFPYSFVLASIIDCINLETNWKILCLILLKLPRILHCNRSLILPYIFAPYSLLSENCICSKCKFNYSSDPSLNDEDCYYVPKIENIMISLTRSLCNITNEKQRYCAIENDYSLQCSQFSPDNSTMSEATRFPSRSEFLARFTFPSLIALVPYHSFLRDNGSETCLRLLHGLESGLRTTVLVSHEPWSIFKQRGLTSALTLACIEMSETASMKFAPKLLLGLSKLSATTIVALPVLEFLSVIANQPPMYSNFIEDEYMSVFAIALPYTNVYKFDHFIISLAHIVIYKWYIKCRVVFRKNFIKFILKGLNSSYLKRNINKIINRGNSKCSTRPRSLSFNSNQTDGDNFEISQFKAKEKYCKEDEGELDKRELKRLASIHFELVETCKEVLARYAFYNNQSRSIPSSNLTSWNKSITNQIFCLPLANVSEEAIVKESWFLPDRLQIITITTYKTSLGGISWNLNDNCGVAKIHIRCVTGDFIWFMRLQQDNLKTMSSEIPKIFNKNKFDQPCISHIGDDILINKETIYPFRKTQSLSDLNVNTYQLCQSPSFYNILNDVNKGLYDYMQIKDKRSTYYNKLLANFDFEMSPSYVFMSLFHNPFSHPNCKDLDSLPIILPRSSDTDRTISVLDCIPSYEAYKIGVIYIANNQPFNEALILSNESGSTRYNDFLQGLGILTKITSPNAKKMYLGGLDIEGIDGNFTYTWMDCFTKVVYHIGTLMPNKEQDPDRHFKKMHIGNDFVTIVYNESGKDYPHGMITGQFCYVSIVIIPLDNSSNLVTLKCRKDMDIHLGGQMSRSLEISDRNLSHMVRQMALQSDLASKVFMRKMNTVAGDPFASNWSERLRHLKRLRSKLPCKSEQFLSYRQKHYYAFTEQDSMELNSNLILLEENDYYSEYPI